MALSPCPLNFFTSSLFFSSSSSSSSSPSLTFLVFQTRENSSNSFRTLKLKTYCSCQTIEVENEEPQRTKVVYKAPKKKRKLRPSFHDIVRDKWSLKIGSQRLKFPWQEQEQEQEENEEEEEGEQQQHSSQIPNSSKENMRNRVISPPWIHGSKPRKTHFDSEIEIAQNSCFKGENFGELSEKLEDLKRIADSNGKSEGEQENEGFSGSSPIEFVGEKEMNCDVNGISLDEKHTGLVTDFVNYSGLRSKGVSIPLPWERNRDLELESVNREKWRRSNTELAEKTIPEPELQRLRNVALRMKERIKVGSLGITQALLDRIHEKWKDDEVVKMKFEGPPVLNMKRTHEVLESKTGGLVIWRSGSSIVLYRGIAYKLPCVQTYTNQSRANLNATRQLKDPTIDAVENVQQTDSVRTTESSGSGSVKSSNGPSDEQFMDISDHNHLLDELGPRFKDWSGCNPQPVDADLLPCVIPGYTPPFRLLPFGIRHCLGNKQMTSYRRFARTMPPHFALGRNRELQGLAMAMVKLWERSAIAKIAIKRGVLNTCNERMAEEIKKLTGGTLVSRNKDYIVFYRGNDFLPPIVTNVLVERQKLADLRQDEEEQARQSASALSVSNVKAAIGPLVAGTLAETMAANSRWGNQPSSEDIEKMKRDLALSKHASLVRYLEKKLTHAQEKVKKAERALGKVQESLNPTELPTDLETITDEERFLFRKIGLSMKPFLVLGRRGVFGGTVENMHLHWKYRELVKIFVKGKSFPQVRHIAISLEAESGGLLISLDKTTKGYAIIIYRGKNYQRPQAIRPKNLLTRRQALARSIELQRREALKHHISNLQDRIELLKSELDQIETVKEMGNEKLYSRLNDAYNSDDDFEEDEGEEAYLGTYRDDDEEDTLIEKLT